VNESSGTALRMRPVSLIGEGVRGQVFIGVDEVLGRQVIIKRLSTSRFESAHRRSTLIREAQILARLDHPNILRIFDYSEDDGFDVFTIEYMSGTTLAEELSAPVDFAKKVRIATAIARALTVAHRAGIVHGALSIDNVLLAPGNAEIKLTDFASTTTHLDDVRSDAKWHSPEQARGEAPTRTSDMYSFGLLLRELFGNRDRDVRALAAALTRVAPSERPTATDALTRLRRLASRRVKHLRMAVIGLVAAFMAIGGIKYTVDMGRERRLAVAARADAEARRAQANAMVGFMIMNIGTKLSYAGRLDLMDSASEKALAYFASIRPQEITADEARVNLEALAQLAQSQMARGDYGTARAILEHAMSVADPALRRAPSDAQLQLDAAGVHALLSNTLEKQGNIDGALAEARLWAKATADLVRRHPGNIEFVQRDASAHGLLGLLYDRKEEILASLHELELDVTVKRRLLPLRDTVEMRLDLAIPIHKLGLALFKVGRFDEARRTLEAGRAELETLLAKNSSRWPMRELLGLYDDDLVIVTMATGDLEAMARYCASHLQRGRQLTDFDSENLTWKRQLVVAHRSYGTLARMRGDLEPALQHHQASVELIEGVFAAGKQNKVLTRDMGLSRTALARTLLAAKRAPAALVQANLAVRALEPAKDELQSQHALADALLVQGEARAANGDAPGAESAWAGALRILEPLDDLSPDPRIADTRVRVLLRRGERERARVLIEGLAAIGYRNREFEAVSREKGAPSLHD